MATGYIFHPHQKIHSYETLEWMCCESGEGTRILSGPYMSALLVYSLHSSLLLHSLDTSRFGLDSDNKRQPLLSHARPFQDENSGCIIGTSPIQRQESGISSATAVPSTAVSSTAHHLYSYVGRARGNSPVQETPGTIEPIA